MVVRLALVVLLVGLGRDLYLSQMAETGSFSGWKRSFILHSCQCGSLPAFITTRMEKLGPQAESLVGERYSVGEVKTARAGWWYPYGSIIDSKP